MSTKAITSTTFNLFATLFLTCISSCYPQGVCDTTPATWDDLINAIEENFGIVFLCPFTISGEACPTKKDQEYSIKSSEVTLLCEPTYSGVQRIGCVIDCPGTHFKIYSSGSLFLDGVTLKGATDSALKVEKGGTLMVYNSIFEGNVNDDNNGGAISAKKDSSMTIVNSRFENNRAWNGGGIYYLGSAHVEATLFLNNEAYEGGGGSIYTGSESRSTILKSTFVGNSATLFGPAVFDGSSTGALQDLNSGCANVFADGSSGCDGVSFLQNGVESCNEFSLECSITPSSSPIVLTLPPSSSPSDTASMKPSVRPSLRPSRLSSIMPTSSPSTIYPTFSPTSRQSFSPSFRLSIPIPAAQLIRPTNKGSKAPSISPSFLPSGSQLPSVIPSGFPITISSIVPSSIPSDQPSKEKTEQQSKKQ